MSEPETLREYLNRPVTSDEAETEGRWDRIMIKHNDPIYDARIINGGLVSPETVERCAEALHQEAFDETWESEGECGQAIWRAAALAVLSSAGYEQWDEVVTVAVGGGIYAVDDEGNEYNVLFDKGDRIGIKRKV